MMMATHRAVLGFCGILAVALSLSTSDAAAADTGVCSPRKETANLDFTVKDMNGKDVALSAYRGQVILLDFWATWCGPCKVEIPGFVDLYKRYRAQGFVVLGVSVDDPVAKLKPFARDLKMNYPVLVGLGRDDLLNAYGPPPGFPTSFLIGRDGVICTIHTGFVPKEQFEREIKALL